jgi:ATP-dependent Clp protease ATP-binding subunit ClpC
MNDAILTELKVVVEQVVRPIRAPIARKRRMREELLTHLLAIFQEEDRHGDDEQAALERAMRRFGDPGQLTGQLQQAVTRWDRYRSVLEQMGCQPNESAWHLAAKHFLLTLLIYLLWLPTVELTSGYLKYLGPEVQYMMVKAVAGAVVVAALFNVILSVILATLLAKIGPVWASTHRGRILLAAFCGSAALCGLALPAFTGAAVLFILMARQAVEEWRYQSAWA